MPMPETAVNEDHLLRARKHEVRPTRKPLGMQPEAVAHGEDQPTHRELGLGVLVPNEAHPLAALARRQGVHGKEPYLSERLARPPDKLAEIKKLSTWRVVESLERDGRQP
jgi:hypothetical protein